MAVLRIAVAQGVGKNDSPDGDSIREQGRRVRELMGLAADGDARLVLFTEGALSGYPDKRRMSSDPHRLAESDWSRVDWQVLAAERQQTIERAGELGLWTVVGSVHREPGPERPFNSLYVISDGGLLVARYDKRYLSNTESSFMYAAGDHATVFSVDGLRFGCALCIEARMSQVFIEYESLGADCVLLASYSDGLAAESLDDRRPLAHALLTEMWIAFAVPGVAPGTVTSGVAAPDDRWLARGKPDGTPQVVFADLDPDNRAMHAGYDSGRAWLARHREAVTTPQP
ncbi:carbon-nitrogen hydrolase family protein [Phytoactinopolyspora endophytica]|uniref:carbon-nitrogen hydrolase family protein n=1 Tax=Phytoactinopolyspora endophytica TaxID=1642495 RepID=UPI00101D1A6D|nr:carbon-nitrogen hydrolase family protein [Phytoactinopolyspora endophytica]